MLFDSAPKNSTGVANRLTEFARLVYRKLRPDGSFVLDLGGSYMKGVPARSLYPFRVLLRFCDDVGFFLAEDFAGTTRRSSRVPSNG
jgi:hypothetical protein